MKRRGVGVGVGKGCTNSPATVVLQPMNVLVANNPPNEHLLLVRTSQILSDAYD